MVRMCNARRMRAIRIASFGVWLLVGLPVVAQGTDSWQRMAQWAIAYILFAVLFAVDLHVAEPAAEGGGPTLVYLALASASILVTVLLLCDGFEGALMALIAMRLGTRVNVRTGVLWIVVQTLLLAVAVTIHWSLRPALLLAPPYLGFQLLAFFTMRFHAMAADRSRIAERLRIAQELHDALGHHLTALTLNLEAALQRTDGEAKRDVEKAQSMARELLADVRAIVVGQNERVDIAQALEAIVASVPQPRVHLEIDPQFRIDDPERAHIVLRCVQEIVTNSARHSGANNLWIVIERAGNQFRIRANDDGRGTAEHSRDGFGLRGMRERLERAGGKLRIDSQPGIGFSIVAVLPS
jgi:signal transduction histidine kinase